MKILLVEDNDLNRDMLSRRLIKRDFTVLSAVNGREGIDKAADMKPDLILMDLSLPIINGWDATRGVVAHLSFTRQIASLFGPRPAPNLGQIKRASMQGIRSAKMKSVVWVWVDTHFERGLFEVWNAYWRG